MLWVLLLLVVETIAVAVLYCDHVESVLDLRDLIRLVNNHIRGDLKRTDDVHAALDAANEKIASLKIGLAELRIALVTHDSIAPKRSAEPRQCSTGRCPPRKPVIQSPFSERLADG